MDEQKSYYAKYKYERYHWLKDHGFCVYCGKEKADEGYISCLLCRMNIREKGDTHKTESAYHHRQWLKRRRDIMYAFGVCVVCGKRDAENGKTICVHCRKKSAIRMEKTRRKNGVFARDSYTKDGECYFCRNPSIPGKKVCEEHYKKCCEAMEKARSAKSEKNMFEQRQELFWKEKNAIRIQYQRRERERYPETCADQRIPCSSD